MEFSNPWLIELVNAGTKTIPAAAAEGGKAKALHCSPGTQGVASGIDACLLLTNVTVAYERRTVLTIDTLKIAKGEFVSVLGPSGCGKSTLLNAVAGFSTLASGSISLSGKRLDRLAPEHRGIGVVFQHLGLFQHMTVSDNVGFALSMQGTPREEKRRRVIRALEIVRLDRMADRMPGQLSGGQQQRVAIARAIVFEPDLVLLDEPLGALDRGLREELQVELKSLHTRLGLTIMMVTHDQGEALALSDRVAIMNAGRIQHIGPPTTLYDNPGSRSVAQLEVAPIGWTGRRRK